jgi:XTP/dITP diphosphohydrolase
VSRRLQSGDTLVVATHNAGKLREMRDLLAPFGLTTVSAGSLGLPEPEETEATFAGNARLKAEAAARGARLPALADDSGLEVAPLGGAPGVLSARWAGPDKNFAIAMDRVADEISARGLWPDEGPRANFICALCLAWPGGPSQVYEGRVDGRLVWPPRGSHGFGYDPMFLPDGEHLTFGEMEPAQKHAISHRARAFALFIADCLDRQS